MRIAIVSDIHGNRRAFDAVLADLREVAPDLIVHGGDLSSGGAHPAEIIEQIQSLGWPGVLGNTDEMLYAPNRLAEFAATFPQLASVFQRVQDTIPWTVTKSAPIAYAGSNNFPIDSCAKTWHSFTPARTIAGVLRCRTRARTNSAKSMRR